MQSISQQLQESFLGLINLLGMPAPRESSHLHRASHAHLRSVSVLLTVVQVLFGIKETSTWVTCPHLRSLLFTRFKDPT